MAWLNQYHAVVWEKVSPRVTDEKVKAGSRKVCAARHGEDGRDWMRAKYGLR